MKGRGVPSPCRGLLVELAAVRSSTGRLWPAPIGERSCSALARWTLTVSGCSIVVDDTEGAGVGAGQELDDVLCRVLGTSRQGEDPRLSPSGARPTGGGPAEEFRSKCAGEGPRRARQWRRATNVP